MRYKRNFWYILGVVLSLASAVVMAVTMVIMYFGNNTAIVVFFAACPVLVFGVLTAQSVKRRYEEADELDREPIPMFWHIRYAVLRLREIMASRGVLTVLFTAVTCLSLIATLVLAVICGNSAYKRSKIENNRDYIANNVAYDEYYALWSDSRREGDKESADKYFEIMESYNHNNAKSRQKIKEYSEDIKKYGVWTALSGAVTVFFGSVLASYLIYKKNTSKRQSK